MSGVCQHCGYTYEGAHCLQCTNEDERHMSKHMAASEIDEKTYMSDGPDPKDAGDAAALVWWSTAPQSEWVKRALGLHKDSPGGFKARYFQAWDIGQEPSYGAKWDDRTGTWKRVR